jgi:hypothetical protein
MSTSARCDPPIARAGRPFSAQEESQAAGRQAVLFLKKKKQKNSSPFFASFVPTLVIASSARRLRRRAASRSTLAFLAANELYGVKPPSRAANRSQTEKSFFGSFFSQKELLPFLPLALPNPQMAPAHEPH